MWTWHASRPRCCINIIRRTACHGATGCSATSPTLSKWGCRLTPWSNWWTQSRLSRWLNEKTLSIDRRRVPPSFAGLPYTSGPGFLPNDGRVLPEVLLFPDTFMNYHEPEIGVATLVLLHRLNHLVINGLPDSKAAKRATPAGHVWPDQLRCCGRPMISNGMLTEAVAAARHNVERLYPWAEQGTPIIACEPSCILTIKDDYPAFLKGDLRAKAQAVAERCFTFEEFVEPLVGGALAARVPVDSRSEPSTQGPLFNAGPQRNSRAGALPSAVAGRHDADAEAAQTHPRRGSHRS